MNNIGKIEEYINKHLIFIYNNINFGDDAMIDSNLVEALYKILRKLNKYKEINVVLQTGGGNLAAGTRIIRCLKEMYDSYEFTILSRCHSTGTFMALSSNCINITPKSIVTPCEPQMGYKGESISTADIRNLLEKADNLNHISSKIDPIYIANYYSTINYFKDLCYSIYGTQKAELIIDYMLNKVNSHQFPMEWDTIRNFGIPVNNIYNTELEKYLVNEENLINEELKDIKTETNLESRLTIISSSQEDVAYIKKYKRDQKKTSRYYEGYTNIERR